MKAALLLPLLVLACAALAEGHTRKTLAPTPVPPRTAGATAATSPPKAPAKVGAGNARPKQGQSAAKSSTGAAKVNWGQAESCYGIGLNDWCGQYEQANCCSGYDDGRDVWQGCAVASNLYRCTSQFDNKPLAVCCS